jgi:WD40 repeat protein
VGVPEHVRLVRVVAVSPGDVKGERKRLAAVIEELNRRLAPQRRCRLELWRWETDAYPGLHLEGPQGLIDAGMRIEDADVVVGIFWTRFGTPTSDAGSGTEHELRRAWAAWQARGRPQVMVYFGERKSRPKDASEAAELQKLLSFREAMPKEQLWWTYTTLVDFERAVREHLTAFVEAPHEPAGPATHPAETPAPTAEADGPRAADDPPPSRQPLPDSRSREVQRVSHDAAVRSVAFSSDGTRLATAGDDLCARVTDLETGRELLRIVHPLRRWHPRKLFSVALHPDGERIATAGRDHTAQVRHLRNGKTPLIITHRHWVRAVSFSPDGEFVATASADGTARVCGLSDELPYLTVTSEKALNAAAFSHDSTRLATAGDDHSACVWDLTAPDVPGSDGVEPLWCVTHDDAVWAVALSPDDTLLATASSDRSARVWKLGQDREALRLDHDAAVWSVAFSPDGRQVATAGGDARARVWNLAERRETLTVEHDDVIFQVSFSPDGRRLATASADHTARVWKL